MHRGAGWQPPSLQRRVFGLGPLKDRDAGVRIFPEHKEILIDGFGFSCIPQQCVRPAQLQTGQHTNGVADRDSGMVKDLGTFPGAIVTGIVCCGTLNNKGDAVGVTVDGTTFNMRAILWHDNKLWDLNTLIPENSGWYLQSAFSVER